MITLSKRQADASNLLESIRKDPVFANHFLRRGYFDQNQLKAATDYISEHYSCGESEAEAVVLSLVRGMVQHASSRLSNRSAQTNHIEIPPTSDNPIGRKIQIADKEESETPPPPIISKPLSIDATPATTKDEKIHDVAKPIVADQESRQQAIIDALQAHKITGNAFVRAMYGVEFTEENLGKYVGKCIEAASSIMAAQTATTVKTLVSPLIGEQ
jgi:hypothetical protein